MEGQIMQNDWEVPVLDQLSFRKAVRDDRYFEQNGIVH